MAMKKLRLPRNPLSDDAITAIAAETLRAGGFGSPQTQPKQPKIGDADSLSVPS